MYIYNTSEGKQIAYVFPWLVKIIVNISVLDMRNSGRGRFIFFHILGIGVIIFIFVVFEYVYLRQSYQEFDKNKHPFVSYRIV